MSIRSVLFPKLLNTHKTSRPVTHSDLYRCLTSGVVVDVGYFTSGALATISGNDLEGQTLKVVAYLPDEDDSLIVEEFFVS